MKKSLFLGIITLYVSALSAQLKFNHTMNQADFNDPMVVVNSVETTSFDASTQTLALRQECGILEAMLLGWHESYVDVALEGAPLEINFDIAYNTPKAIDIGVKIFDDGCGFTLPTVLGGDNSSDLGKPMFWLAESADGVTYKTTYSWRHSKKEVFNNKSDASKGFGFKHKSVRLKETTRFVRLGYRANFQGLYRNIIVTPLHSDLQLDINPRALDFGRMHHNTADQSDDKTMEIDAYWRNLSNITLNVDAYKSTAAQQMYTLSDATLGTNEIGSGSKKVSVTNHPSAAVGEYKVTKAAPNGAVIRIHAASSYPNDERICNIPLSVQTCQNKRTITWYEGQDTIVVRNNETLNAATISPQTGVNVTYRIVESKGTATINTSTLKTSAAPTAGVVVMEAYWNGSGTGNRGYADACERRTFVVVPEHGYLYESSLCKGDSIELGGRKIYADVNKTEIITLRTADDQADSTIVLIMTVHNHVEGITDAVRVAEYDLPYTWEGMTFTEADIKQNVLKTRFGCDSAVTMTVSLIPTYYKTDTVCKDEFPISWTQYLGKDEDNKDVYDTIHVFTDYGVATHIFTTENGDSAMQYKVVRHDTIFMTPDNHIICQGDSTLWYGQYYKEAGEYTENSMNECGTPVVNKLSLTILLPTTATPIDTAICAADTADFEWHGHKYITGQTEYKDTAYYALGCDSMYYTLNLTLLTPTPFAPIDTAICAADTADFEWHGHRYITGQTEYKDTAYYALGCDSVYYTLNLTLLTPTPFAPIDSAICSADTADFEWHGHRYITGQTEYKDTAYYALGCDSVYYTLNLTVNPSVLTEFADTTCPAIPYVWEGDTYTKTGNYRKTFPQVVGCDSVVILHLVVETPNPDLDTQKDNMPASNKYNSWLLMLDKGAVEDTYHLSPAESDVTWYRVVGEMDSQMSDAVKDDEQVGQGYYYTDDRHLTDAYYALINVPASATDDGCGAIYRTVVLNVQNAAPLLLLPTRVAPSAQLQLFNLDVSPSTIRIYNTTGQMLKEYHTAGTNVAAFEAAAANGVYMVVVSNENQNETLKYIVGQ